MRREGTAEKTIDLSRGWTVRWEGCAAPIAARVPGYAQHDMMDAGLLPDPFPGTNEDAWQPACDRGYVYECQFDLPGAFLALPRVELVFDGIDTAATIKLNGTELGSVDNMCRTWRFPVKERLKQGLNKLRVAIRAPRAVLKERKARLHESSPILASADERAYLRKMPCSFGWDWGIALPLSGIWKPVRLEGWSAGRITGLWHETKEAIARRAVVHGWVMLESHADVRLKLDIVLAGPGRVKLKRTVPVAAGQDSVPFVFDIPKPELWWPNGLGPQPLYTLDVRLKAGGKVVSSCTRRIGVRTLEIVNEPDRFGSAFHVRVNGVPVFAKGANWIPADAIPSRLTKAEYRRLVCSARDAHMNMLRVWGGGMYESDHFYDLCDEYGIMVWHDLMFACNVYPVHREFLYSVGAEVRDALSRLQHHPCIALWCGNNECEEKTRVWDRMDDVKGRDYYLLFEEYLAGVVRDADPSRLYWPSSSHAPFSNSPYRQDTGDTHFWAVWHGGKPFEAYLERTDRFMTEFGFQSFPDIHTVSRYAQPEEREFDSVVMKAHQKNGGGNARIVETMSARYGLPASFAHQLVLSQIVQADAIRMGVEHWRRHCTECQCMGALFWQLNDNWPVASWSSIDYFGRWKALHFSARRFFAPVMLSAFIEHGSVNIVLVNDGIGPLNGALDWSVMTYDGAVVSSGTKRVTAQPLAATGLLSRSCRTMLDGRDTCGCFLAASWRDGNNSARSILPFSLLKEARLSDPGLAFVLKGNKLTVRADQFASNVHIDLADPALQPSDNFFDLLPGEERTVAFVAVKPEKGTPRKPKASAVTVLSLWDLLKG